MKYNYCLVLIIMTCVYASYVNVQKSKTNLAKTELATVINEYITSADNKRVINKEVSADNEKNSAVSGRESREETKVLDDNSKLDIMYDGFGNKTEARCFNNHPRLTCVVLSSAVNGQRKVLVYGQNGDIKELPENLLDKVTTASADEIANSAGIYAARQQKTQSENAQTTAAPTLAATLKQIEASQSSIRNLPSEQIETENADNPELTTAGPEVKFSPTIGNIQPRENEKPPASNRPPEEKK